MRDLVHACMLHWTGSWQCVFIGFMEDALVYRVMPQRLYLLRPVAYVHLTFRQRVPELSSFQHSVAYHLPAALSDALRSHPL